MKEFTMRLRQQIRLFLVLSVIVLWTQSVYSDVYYVASSPAFTTPKAHIWNSAGGDPMYSWNADDEAMTSVGTATDGSTIYSYTYNGAYNQMIIHDNGLYESIWCTSGWNAVPVTACGADSLVRICFRSQKKELC